jgi:hypothetical protein
MRLISILPPLTVKKSLHSTPSGIVNPEMMFASVLHPRTAQPHRVGRIGQRSQGPLNLKLSAMILLHITGSYPSVFDRSGNISAGNRRKIGSRVIIVAF